MGASVCVTKNAVPDHFLASHRSAALMTVVCAVCVQICPALKTHIELNGEDEYIQIVLRQEAKQSGKKIIQKKSRKVEHLSIILGHFGDVCGALLGNCWGSLRRSWTKLGGNSSYKPPGASYSAQAPQKQTEILEHLFF